MRTFRAIAPLTLGLLGTAGLIGHAAAQGTFSAWGHDFTLAPFQTQTLEMTTATEKATGHKMNLVKLKNGHLMALVPADRYMALMTTPAEDMMP
ncbi:hypothetical protein [Beijerinckia sp. L45]|uniref:hypothetical protein n=1 Tax=Beijerinckia sp. L45 TaxID=1641855 RepID=UPI001FF07078|nr:hypothetical protein [Beijerinckia sp. L45]